MTAVGLAREALARGLACGAWYPARVTKRKIEWEITIDEQTPGPRVVRAEVFDEVGGAIGAVECEWQGRGPSGLIPVDHKQALAVMQDALAAAFERATKKG